MEYTVGHERVREPDRLLNKGETVQFHTHRYHHNTHITMGVVKIHRRLKMTDLQGTHIGWTNLPDLLIAGGGPRSVVPVPANVEHMLEVIEGPAFYRCCFALRDRNGNLSEVDHSYEEAYQ